MAYRKDTAQPQHGGSGFARTAKAFGRTVTITAVDNTTANTVGAFTVPAGFVVTGIIAVGSNMGAGQTISVGDATLANRYLSAATITSATVTALLATGLLYKNTAETEILITVVAQGAAQPAGTIQLYLTGFIDN